MKKGLYALVCLGIVLLCFLGGGLLESLPGQEEAPKQDFAMQTDGYHVRLEVLEDGSYQVEERIQVNMLEERHGIYRYIPLYGSSVYDGETEIPYYGKIKLLETNAPVEISSENGCRVFRLGSEEQTVYGPTEYRIRYRFTPWFQKKGYSNAYYNLFPNMWQNPIPAGSSFSVAFPKDFGHEALKFYGGDYGSREDATEMLDLRWDGNMLQGTLREELGLGEGITFFAAMPEGYFTEDHALLWPKYALLVLALGGLAVTLLLFLAFGRDETIYPSIQYQPPEKIDSAAVGYIIDGVVEDRDVLSLILYWADQGFLIIEEKKKGELLLRSVRSLPSDAPGYAQTMFQKLFEKGDACDVKKMTGKFYETIGAVKAQVKMGFQKENALYTMHSRLARGAAAILCALPFGAFLVLIWLTSYSGALALVLSILCYLLFLAGVCALCHGVDFWHSKSDSERIKNVVTGLAMIGMGLAGYGGGYLQRVRDLEAFSYVTEYAVLCAASVAMALLTAFMRKRTHTCVEWMGKLLGLRDFIETAELNRLQALAEETPGLFYHILPYAYVLGLSDVFARRLKGLALEPPQWYRGAYGRPDGRFDYYIFHRSLMRGMDATTKALAVPEPSKNSGGSSGSSFSEGGGGFSGGGFGGGGGGSW